MARRTSLSRNRQISELNMTPLIDLTFLLLITFIITFPLIEQGIPSSRIQTVSFGKEMPADPGNNDAAWAKNRRTETGVVK